MFPSVDKACSTHRYSSTTHTLHSCGSLPLDNRQVVNSRRTGRPHVVHKGGNHEILNILSSSLTWSKTSWRSFMTCWVFSTAWMTVVWSRPPNNRAIAG